MSLKRLSYQWTHGVIYTLKWSFIITTIFGLIIQIISHPDRISIKVIMIPILAINGFMVPIMLTIGLRPVLGLWTRLNTLFADDNDNLYVDGVKIDLKNIDCVDIKEIGLGKSHMQYYEISFKIIPNELRSKLRKRSTLICTEKYDIKYIFNPKMILLDELIKMGLNSNLVNYKYGSLKNIFGIRDKFKK